ncbi:hypothetical protein BDV96DRAFT_644505 [Lophiotrema nucula]|uniref:Uncharacterized protein n=1 Tax=Lophiotrema nucula TaxID=690887 RepID=A0A6A5ZDS7_9PLEO|nr:hypothetical protein BDV96DRAFT_644505 [Lophiotrema nucula]
MPPPSKLPRPKPPTPFSADDPLAPNFKESLVHWKYHGTKKLEEKKSPYRRPEGEWMSDSASEDEGEESEWSTGSSSDGEEGKEKNKGEKGKEDGKGEDGEPKSEHIARRNESDGVGEVPVAVDLERPGEELETEDEGYEGDADESASSEVNILEASNSESETEEDGAGDDDDDASLMRQLGSEDVQESVIRRDEGADDASEPPNTTEESFKEGSIKDRLGKSKQSNDLAPAKGTTEQCREAEDDKVESDTIKVPAPSDGPSKNSHEDKQGPDTGKSETSKHLAAASEDTFKDLEAFIADFASTTRQQNNIPASYASTTFDSTGNITKDKNKRVLFSSLEGIDDCMTEELEKVKFDATAVQALAQGSRLSGKTGDSEQASEGKREAHQKPDKDTEATTIDDAGADQLKWHRTHSMDFTDQKAFDGHVALTEREGFSVEKQHDQETAVKEKDQAGRDSELAKKKLSEDVPPVKKLAEQEESKEKAGIAEKKVDEQEEDVGDEQADKLLEMSHERVSSEQKELDATEGEQEDLRQTNRHDLSVVDEQNDGLMQKKSFEEEDIGKEQDDTEDEQEDLRQNALYNEDAKIEADEDEYAAEHRNQSNAHTEDEGHLEVIQDDQHDDNDADIGEDEGPTEHKQDSSSTFQAEDRTIEELIASLSATVQHAEAQEDPEVTSPITTTQHKNRAEDAAVDNGGKESTQHPASTTIIQTEEEQNKQPSSSTPPTRVAQQRVTSTNGPASDPAPNLQGKEITQQDEIDASLTRTEDTQQSQSNAVNQAEHQDPRTDISMRLRIFIILYIICYCYLVLMYINQQLWPYRLARLRAAELD